MKNLKMILFIIASVRMTTGINSTPQNARCVHWNIKHGWKRVSKICINEQASYVLELEFNKAKIAILPLICTCNKISIKISTFVVFCEIDWIEANHETHMERQRIQKGYKKNLERRIKLYSHFLISKLTENL